MHHCMADTRGHWVVRRVHAPGIRIWAEHVQGLAWPFEVPVAFPELQWFLCFAHRNTLRSPHVLFADMAIRQYKGLGTSNLEVYGTADCPKIPSFLGLCNAWTRFLRTTRPGVRTTPGAR